MLLELMVKPVQMGITSMSEHGSVLYELAETLLMILILVTGRGDKV